jgi:hypothetical protein
MEISEIISDNEDREWVGKIQEEFKIFFLKKGAIIGRISILGL